MSIRRRHWCVLVLVLTLQIVARGIGRDTDTVDLPPSGTMDSRPFFATRRHPAIDYDRPTTDVVAGLIRRMDEGAVTLRWEGSGGYLRSVMEALQLPVASQSVLFSKTSLQQHYISPSNPRAIFFSDNVIVAFIRNAPLLEIAALDPRQGMIFYALQQAETEPPHILRADACLSCHEVRETLGVPGLLARSLAVGSTGQPLPEARSVSTDHRTPFDERWGGWFITGRTGRTRHMGNTLFSGNGSSVRPSGPPPPLRSLEGKFDPDGYPSLYSDVAAVMTLNHQVRMINLMTRVGYETRIALDDMQKDAQSAGGAHRLIAADAGELVDYMLFVDEAPLPEKFESTSGFREEFERTGLRDRQGRSLKELDLETRLLRYPCSYMIYSPAFDGLPDATKDAIYARMWDVLSGQNHDRKYAKLTPRLRADIVGILLDTKPGLPSYFHALQ
ncbi:MAG TPA: hypothetical protein VL173_12950 [Vicinamibacterales bacterium]|nr:hypothetical protein [Vicinamibacterales bacterium]